MTTKAKAKTSHKTGRPTKYTEALAAEICRRIVDGASLRSVCEAEDMPDRETVRRWLREKGGGCGQYDDGRPGEVFIHRAKPGSDVDLLCDDRRYRRPGVPAAPRDCPVRRSIGRDLRQPRPNESWVSGGAPMPALEPTPIANPRIRALPPVANC